MKVRNFTQFAFEILENPSIFSFQKMNWTVTCFKLFGIKQLIYMLKLWICRIFEETLQGLAQVLDLVINQLLMMEVKDLHKLLLKIKTEVNFDAISSGAILKICKFKNFLWNFPIYKLFLMNFIDFFHFRYLRYQSNLAYLWIRNQMELLDEIIGFGIESVIIRSMRKILVRLWVRQKFIYKRW